MTTYNNRSTRMSSECIWIIKNYSITTSCDKSLQLVHVNSYVYCPFCGSKLSIKQETTRKENINGVNLYNYSKDADDIVQEFYRMKIEKTLDTSLPKETDFYAVEKLLLSGKNKEDIKKYIHRYFHNDYWFNTNGNNKYYTVPSFCVNIRYIEAEERNSFDNEKKFDELKEKYFDDKQSERQD